MTGRMTLKSMGLEGSMESWNSADGKHLQVMRLPGIGEMAGGFTGKSSWSQDPINGLRILEGAEAEQAKLDGAWLADANLKKLYPGRKVIPVPEAAALRKAPGVEMSKLECLEMTPASAKLSPAIMCFDPRTHLRVYHEGRQHTPQGVVPFSRVQSDWREVGGWMVPHKEEFTVGPASMSFTLDTVTWNPKIPPSRFKMPRPGQPISPAKI